MRVPNNHTIRGEPLRASERPWLRIRRLNPQWSRCMSEAKCATRVLAVDATSAASGVLVALSEVRRDRERDDAVAQVGSAFIPRHCLLQNALEENN